MERCFYDMVFHMKTTLVIDDGVMRRLKAEAARRGTTISNLVESALRAMLDDQTDMPHELPPLPCFDLGDPSVDVADRNDLFRAMEGE
jgi:hypothetical protein